MPFSPFGASLVVFSFVYLLLSSMLPLLPAVPVWSSFSFWWPFPPSLSVMALAFLGVSLPIELVRFRFSSSTVRYLLRFCWVSLPCVLCILLFLASFGYVLVFFLFASFVTRSNLSSFATGPSLRAECPLSVVACLISHGFGSCPLVFGILPLLGILLSFLLLFAEWVTLLFIGSSLEFLYLSLFVDGLQFPSALVFVSLTPFYCSLLLGVFSALFLYGYHFLLFYSFAVAVVLYIYFLLLYFLSLLLEARLW